MNKRGEFGESSSHARSPSPPPLQTPWSHSPNHHRNQNLFPGDSSSSSSRLCLRSPSDYSISSYFSNGLCSSDDGSSRFASPPSDGMMTTAATKHYKFTDEFNSLGGYGLGLCESINRLNIREEEEEEKNNRHYFTGNQLSNLWKFEEPNDGGFRFGVDKPSLFPNQNPSFQSYGDTLESYDLGYKSNKSMMEPFIFDKSFIMEEAKPFNNHSVSPYSHRKSFVVGTLFDHQGSSSSNSDTNHPRFPKISEIQGYVYLMAKDQHGCKILQRIFEDGASPLETMVVFNEVLPHAAEIMMNPFGNYLMQKLLDVCNEEQITQIILMVTTEPGVLVRIALNTYGTRVVQRLVEVIKTKKQSFLVKSALRPGFLNLATDINGNHVIQRCLQWLSTEDNEFIFEEATRFCVDIATHRHGCCVLQKCIAYSTGQEREKLITEIARNSLFLAQDPYGNYAVQVIIKLRDLSAIATMLAHLKGHYVELSMQKFSSHLVERCLTHCPESRLQIVRELISVPHFDLLIQDPYANFVIQAALTATKGSLHDILVEVIKPHSILRNNPFCKKIFSRNLLKD
ncbi:unnamed protein product [Thlaspi arvense]|uniref:PUM-HD domain-containing protein n=1 Tax=Thlaspi arvense TaxID=13288 RepID=A0AAU9R5D8_THLAR|nr:unnamed protein product [Thlaspi arvense]